MGDCTYAGVEILELLVEASDCARQESLGFVVVLPYSANALVRRLLLEIAPELATDPDRPFGSCRLGPAHAIACHRTPASSRGLAEAGSAS